MKGETNLLNELVCIMQWHENELDPNQTYCFLFECRTQNLEETYRKLFIFLKEKEQSLLPE